jgi:hypothetical protein
VSSRKFDVDSSSTQLVVGLGVDLLFDVIEEGVSPAEWIDPAAKEIPDADEIPDIPFD